MTPVERLYQWLAVLCAAAMLLSGYFAVTLKWHAAVDFDVTGFLFLVQNLPRLTAIVVTVLAFGLTVECFLRSRGIRR